LVDGSRYDVFLSHTSSDKPVVEELARILRERGIEPWLDAWHLIPGAPWQEEIEKALQSCATVAVCLGPSGTGPWQNEEMRAAINRRVTDREGTFRVIPVLLPGAERGERSRLPMFLAATTWIEFRDTLDDKRALHRLVCGIRGVEPDHELENLVVVEGVSPYRGLQVFDVKDARFFFGREALTQWLLDKLRPASAENRFLAIVGPSGSGKSSLARAGLLASLRQGEAIPGSQEWPAAVCKPGTQPLESLAVALTSAARLDSSPLDLIRDLGVDARTLHLTTRLALHDAPPERRFIVLVDQFEEAFTLCSDETQRRIFIESLLHAATAAEGRTVIVLTLRADFYGRCAAYPNLAAAVSDRQILVGAMSREELRRAIERPALLVGCELEAGLVDLLLEEVEGQPGSLPLLQHALLQLWDRRKGRRLTVEAYREIGGVEGALEKYAEGVYGDLPEAEKEVCHQVLLRLVQIGEGTVPIRRRLLLDDLKPVNEAGARAVEHVVHKLADARLLTTGDEKNPTVELSHEALTTGWKKLTEWIEADREALLVRRQLDDAVEDWIANGREPSYLYRGARLAQAEKWAASRSASLNRPEREFLDASLALRSEERRREKTQTQRLKRLAVGVVAGLVLTVLAGSTGVWLWRTWQRQMKILAAHNVAEKVQSVFPSRPSLGLLLAAESVRVLQRVDEPNSVAEEEALRWALGRSGGRALESGRVTAVAQTADRRFLVTAGMDGTAQIWDLTAKEPATSGRVLTSLGEGTVSALALTADRRWLLTRVTSGAEPYLFLRDLSSQEKRRSLPDEDWLDSSDPFSQDGRWLITNQTGKAILRDLRTGTVHDLQTEDLRAAAFSPDSRWLATASNRNPVALRDLHSADPTIPVRVLPGSEGPLESLAFGPDGYRLAASAGDGSARVWRLIPGDPPGTPVVIRGCKFPGRSRVSLGPKNNWLVLEGDRGACMRELEPLSAVADLWIETRKVAFSADGRWHLYAAERGTVLFMGPKESIGTPRMFIAGGQVEPIRFIGSSPDSRWILIQGDDEPPRLWDTYRGMALTEVEPETVTETGSSVLAISPDGRWLADRRDVEVVLRNVTGNAKSRKLRRGGHVPVPEVVGGKVLDPVRDWAWAVSPGGAWLAAADPRGGLVLWRFGDGEFRLVPGVSAPAAVSPLVFSPDGRWLAAGTDRGDVLLWDLRTPHARHRELVSHPPRGATAIAFSSDGRWLATAGGDGLVRRYRLDGDQPRAEVARNRDDLPITALALSRGGEWLAAAGDAGEVVLWKPGEEERHLSNRSGVLQGLAFSPEGSSLAGFSRSGSAQLWRLGERTATGPVSLSESEDRVEALAFSSDGKVVTASQRGRVRRWELKLDQLLKLACRTVGRNLTEKEWKEYFQREPYRENEPCPEYGGNFVSSHDQSTIKQ
jgi:WD40 repeat protein/energy-coupling factor transporter ATP-binding protein EcfA2